MAQHGEKRDIGIGKVTQERARVQSPSKEWLIQPQLQVNEYSFSWAELLTLEDFNRTSHNSKQFTV